MPDAEREQRFLELTGASRSRLVRIARAYAGAEWPDLHQDILLQIWRSLDSFEGRADASTWVYRVALNTALTWRRRALKNPVVPATGTVDPTGDLNPRDPLLVLDEFLSALNAIDRAILLLYLEAATYAQIADVTGLSESHVGVRLNRIKRAFTDRYIGEPRCTSTN